MKRPIRNWFLDRSLTSKLILVFAPLLLFLVVVTNATLKAFRDFENAEEQARQSSRIKSHAIYYLDRLNSIQSEFRGYLLTGDRSFLHRYDESSGDLDLAGHEFARLVQYSPSQAQRDRVANVQSIARRLIQEKDWIIERVKAGRRNEGVAYIRSGRGRILADAITSRLHDLDHESASILQDRQDVVMNKRDLLLDVIVGGTLLALVMAGLGVVIVAHSVTKPMVSLAEAAGKIGEEGVAVFPDAARQDEVGILSRSMDEMQKRLHPAERLAALTRMATSIAHDLRTPLIGIERGLQGLQYAADAQLSPDARQLLGDLRTGARLAMGIVQDILDLYRQAFGEIPLSYSQFMLDVVIREAVDLMRAEIRDRRLAVSVKALPLEISADERRLYRVMINLLDNAIKNSPAGGGIWVWVSVRGEGPDRRAVVAVEDEGKGLDPETVKTLFEPNRPISTPTRGGTGLGLYLCRLIVEAHAGILAVQNRPEGGARFTFDIPVEVHHVNQASDRGRPAPV